MTIMMRDRLDGQVEVVLMRPEVIGVMRDHDLAAQFIAFLTERDPELKLAGDAVPLHSEAETLAETLEEIAAVADAADGVAPKARVVKKVQLPAVVALPSPPARRAPERLKLTEEQRDAAFQRLGGGRAYRLCRARFWAVSGAAEGRLGAPLQNDAAPLGRGWPGGLQAVHQALHAFDFASRNLRAVQP